MKEHVQAVVIGGGVVGASVLYHLTKFGWKDVLLIERAELTSGSTWHAAGGMHTVNGDPNVARLQQYTIKLYEELEQISGVSCGMHVTGGLMLAGTRERFDWLKMTQARGRYLGMELELLSIDEAARIYPLMDKKHFTGAIYDPIEGHIDPYGVTHAYAKSAQIGGASIVRQTRVVDLRQRADGSWDVITTQGNVHAEHVVNCGGLWAREVGRMVGLELPILAMEHQYLITEDLPFLATQPKEQLHVIDFEGEIYMRQERGGMLIGDFTMCRLHEERFFLIGTYAAETWYRRWFERHLPPAGVTVRTCAMEYVGLALAGPASRAILQSVCSEDLSGAAFPFMSFRAVDVGWMPALVGRVSFTGELGYEIWVSVEYQRGLYDLLMHAGRAHGLRLFGGRALNSMRLEKSFGNWAREFRPIYGPFEAGLGRFVNFDKGEFIGREAALAERSSGGTLRLLAFVVDAADADAIGDEPIWHDGAVVGWVTSGGYGHRVEQSLALGYVPAALGNADTGFEIEIIGERRAARRLAQPAFDPQGMRMRS
jgi:glycine cleavage system aminomethyltransferase T